MKTNELKAEFARSEKTYEDIAKLLDISLTSIQRKVNGANEFKPSEIAILKNVLNLTPNRIDEIFYN